MIIFSVLKVKLRALVGRILAKMAEFQIAIGGFVVKAPAPVSITLKSNVSVLSFFERHNGISAGALWQIEALEAVGIHAYQLDATPAIRKPWFQLRPNARGDTTYLIVHTDGQRLAVALNALPKTFRSVYRVGYCAWELPSPPRAWGRFDRFLHEVWTPSEFSRRSLQQVCDKPVRVVRHVVRAPANVNGLGMRHRLGLCTTDFVVLAMADVRSSLARKNPLGAIAAFKQGLGKYDDSVLLLKVTGADHDAAAFENLRSATTGSRVVLLLDRLSMEEQWQVYAASDVFVSLHRAEGYGLPMAEAMAVGRPVVGTAWSGNLDYMHAGNSALVDYKLVEIDDPQGVYSGSTWAEPSVEHAAEWLQRLRTSLNLRSDLGNAAAVSMALHQQMAEFAMQIKGQP